MVQQETADKIFDSRNISDERLAKLHSALVAFIPPDERLLRRPPKGFSRCPVREVDEYFELVARVGKPLFKWDIIRPAFLWKLELTMSEMLCVEAESLADGSKDTMISDEELRSQREFIMRKASEFDGTPFTIQRLCELLTTPSRHYKRTDKYLRALEKNINVVTTVTENGERVSGVEEMPMIEDERPQRIEQNFFLKVDECDFSMDTKMSGDHMKMENGSAVIKSEESSVDEATPMNLSAAKRAIGEPAPEPVKKEDEMDVDETERSNEVKMESEDTAKEESGTYMEQNGVSDQTNESKMEETEKEEKPSEPQTANMEQ